MPYATGKGLHQTDIPLSNLSMQYANDRSAYFAQSIAPKINVAHESDKYYVFGRDHFRIPQTLRANGAAANEVDYSLSTATYSLDQHSLREFVSDRDISNADSGLRPMEDAMQNVVDRILLKKEDQAMSQIFTTTSFTNNHSLTSTLAWSALTTLSDPIGDVSTATSVILQNTGQQANAMIIGYNAFEKGLKNHPNILDRIKYSERGIITEDMLASLFGISNIKIGRAVKNTSVEGGTDSMSFVWDKDCFIGHISATPRLKSPSALYNFVKSGNGNSEYTVKKYRNEDRGGTFVEVNTFNKLIATGDAAGYLIRGVNT